MSAQSPSRVYSFVLIAVVLLGGLVLAEIALRWTLYPIQRPYHFEQDAVIADPATGYRLATGSQTIMTDGHFRATVATDALGLRDRFDPALPDDGLIAIGDSQTFGHGVEARDSWPERLQMQLGVNVRNAGVFGYGVTSMNRQSGGCWIRASKSATSLSGSPGMILARAMIRLTATSSSTAGSRPIRNTASPRLSGMIYGSCPAAQLSSTLRPMPDCASPACLALPRRKTGNGTRRYPRPSPYPGSGLRRFRIF